MCGLEMRRMVAHGHVEVADLQGWRSSVARSSSLGRARRDWRRRDFKVDDLWWCCGESGFLDSLF
jgi:hypothetical protein